MIRNYRPNHAGVGALLRGPDMRRLVQHKAELAQALYRARVARRTGRLARETRVFTFIGGPKNDRWIGRMVAYAPYAALHEFDRVDDNGRVIPGARDLAAVLARMDSLP
ncbi:hypothetical protein [Prescottella equi]|uniref:hypothetical protein n=1 Tax=Rhodococcus hoagii TaxID=43767 RepID=UPI0007CD6AEA|nr:hypothetical protein [Prescottella equi]